jgi:Cation transport protein
VRAAAFEVTSIVTTTGYFTVDYGQWPTAALMTLALLFFVGGCAGSTAGAIKVARHLLIARLLGRPVVATAHPELVRPVRRNGVIVDQQTLLAVIWFVLIYVAVFGLGTAVLAVEATVRGPEMEALDLIHLRLRVEPRQRGRRARARGHDRLVRAVRRHLDDRDDRAHVARAARDRAGRRAAAAQLLARLIG